MSDNEIVFEVCPKTPAFSFDEKLFPEAVGCSIPTGPHAGLWLFSNKDRAEEFAWKRKLKYRFEEDHSFEPSEQEIL
jgi:hypothetical protein